MRSFKAVGRLIQDRILMLKIQLFITVLILVPIAILGTVYYREAKGMVIKNFGESNQQALDQFAASVELVVNNIIDISKQSYNDSRLNQIMASADADEHYADWDYINQKINQIKASNRYVHSVYLYLAKNDKVISTEYGISDAAVFPDLDFMKWYKNDSRTLIVSDTHPVKFWNNSPRTLDVFSVYAHLPLDRANNYNGALIINIDQSLVYRELHAQIQNGGETPFLVLNSKKEVIVSGLKEDLYTDIRTRPSFQHAFAGTSGSFVSNVGDKEQLVVYNTAENRGWTYVAMYPFGGITGSIHMIRNIIVLMSFVLLAFSLIVSLLFTMRAVKPVDELRKHIRARTRRILGKGNELGVIRDAVLDILDNHEQLEEKLELTVPVFREKILNNLIWGVYTGWEEIEDNLKLFALDIPRRNLTLMLLELDVDEGTGGYKARNDSILLYSVLDAVTEYFGFRQGIASFSLVNHSNQLVVALESPSAGAGELLAKIRELQQQLLHRLQVSFTAIVSDEPTDLLHIARNYREVRELLKYKILYGRTDIMLTSDIRSGDKTAYNYPYDKEELLKNNIRACNKNDALALFMEMLGGISKDRRYQNMYQFVFHLNSTLMALINELGLSVDEIYGEEYSIDRLSSLNGKERVEIFFSGLIHTIIDVIEANKTTRASKYYQRIAGYIKDHYMQDITLESVSEQVNLSPTYINQILKAHTGSTFVQLLNNTRIEQACSMLQEEDLKIKDIAQWVGFSSSKYFIKIFKEIKGITPGKYVKGYHIDWIENP
ncbi:AraC family transcriptional regulator [Paenibacillus glycinis]|uniref:Helix-turn-helix domain-containing protein n=1 Tax=Paenibacillus glycinis TaxID=2697035 RepID=A0ABW9XK40_9BACL|nr:AraC family transcriptional regulator [Paenibacillus glycinis]NBD22967.1 helix-turn-helix domain-containing protein [Paenibacillus glycinis]